MTIVDIWNATLGDVKNKFNQPILYKAKHEHFPENESMEDNKRAFYCKFFWGYCIHPAPPLSDEDKSITSKNSIIKKKRSEKFF